MQTLSSQLLNSGAAIKGEPGLDPAQILLASTMTQQIQVPAGETPVTVIPKYNQLQPKIDDTPNVLVVAEPLPDKNLMIFAAAGLGALLLLNKNKTVSGIGKPGKDLMLPVLLIGGVAAYYFYSNKKDTTTTEQPVAANNAIPLHVAPNPAPPKGNTLPIEIPINVVEPARNATAATQMQVLQRDWPAVAMQLNAMTDLEILFMYQYFYAYVLYNKKLYRNSGDTGVYIDGDWNTGLYDGISAIRAKYNLYI